ncbi:hypothetical protein [Hymenobacter sp. GOD-10R]|uniref:hypothetical protein n=1 Tax=Hymenobacter sp. GOD-10R TaxID=3093922 RepID=UPI002D782C5F|nr:hypothetical protein [Hymenobacter sp. GOD-10R]WRQ30993.1 hypothetical protein SD425_12055 [Hymenobacter sp. GOD-10R]
MQKHKPNYTDLGLSSPMGPQLRKLVEEQLIVDLRYYHIDKPVLKFDWSESCIEGNDAIYLDGYLENYSGITIFDEADCLVADGWMDFVLAGDFFLVYWDFITTWDEEKQFANKSQPGIPDHIWLQIPDDIKGNYKNERMKQPPFSSSTP